MANTYTGRLCSLHIFTYALVLIGAINWGLVGVGWFVDTNLNVVNLLFGSWPTLEYLIYAVVWLSAVFMLFQGSCSQCSEKKM